MSTATSAGVDYTVPPNINGSGASNNHGAAARVGTSSSNFDNVAVSRTQRELYGSTVGAGPATTVHAHDIWDLYITIKN